MIRPGQYDNRMRSFVSTDGAPRAIGPYSQGVRAGNLLFVSGQIPLDPETGRMIDGGIEVQAEQVLRNIAAVVEASGGKLTDVVKTTVYLKDLGDFEKVNGVYGRFFAEHRPARAAVEVSDLPKGAKIEIEAIAVIDGS